MSRVLKKRIGEHTMHLDVEDGGISAVLYAQGQRELAFMGLLQEEIKEGMVCVDLGSNIGYTTLYMLQNAGQDGFVYAIEPDPRNLSLLQKNIEENSYQNCEVIHCAISDNDGEIDFWEAAKPNLSSVTKNKYSTNKISVPSFTLESFLQDRRYPNFIKMDVEGHEVKIFESGLDYFSKNDGYTSVLVEVHPATYNEENDFAAVLREYFKIGFNAKYVVATPVPQPQLFKMAGYSPARSVHTDGFHRGIYTDVSNEHLVKFACQEHWEQGSKKIVRSFMITREK
tara:strand:- start:11955 stop:12806 length:852 start_codon:yes stop_codon:yes gene_type:complete